MIDEVKSSHCDFVKFQLWNPINLVPGPWDKDGRREIYDKSFLSYEKYFELYDYSISKKLKCFASVFDHENYKILKQISNEYIKIPSSEAYDIDLIKRALKDFKNVIVSTGALKKNELDNLKQFKNENNFYILHCVSSYPLNYSNCNFDKFFYLKKNFKQVGYSGHAPGIFDAIYALSNGAIIVEKHFTIDQNLEGRDNKFAILPEELKKICDYEKLLISLKFHTV